MTCARVDTCFGHADFLAGCVCGHGEWEERVVCEADIFRGDYYHAACDVEGVFTGGDHAREVVESSVGVAAANRFVERGDGVVVLVAGAVVDEGFGQRGIELGECDGGLCVRREIERSRRFRAVRASPSAKVSPGSTCPPSPVKPRSSAAATAAATPETPDAAG